MAWRVANSLIKLRDQVNGAYPARSKASDGTIGNAAHAATASDHNPNAQGVVCGMDLTNDPAHGFDAHALAEKLRTHRHPALKYLISNKRIAGAWTGWKWVAYTGINPHDKHIHVSVGIGSDGKSTGNYDDATNWVLTNEETDTVKPTQQQVKDAFARYMDAAPNADQLKYYPSLDISVLYKDVLETTIPSAKEVTDVYGALLPETKDANAVPYYTGKPKWLLYKNVAGAVKSQLDEAKQAKPQGSNADSEALRKIKEGLGIN